LAAILSLLPLDDFVDAPAVVIDVPGEQLAIYDEFQTLLAAAEGRPISVEAIDRFTFVDRAKSAYVVVATGERRLYGNIILKKGVIRA
jgi:L-fucose mutarotase